MLPDEVDWVRGGFAGGTGQSSIIPSELHSNASDGARLVIFRSARSAV